MSCRVVANVSLFVLILAFASSAFAEDVITTAIDSPSLNATAQKFIWKDCGSTLAKIESIQFQGCAHSSHMGCRIIRGTNVSASVTFSLLPSTPAVAAAETRIHAVIFHVPIPWAPDNVDACKGCGLTCPLNVGKSYTYTLGLHVKKIYPSVRATIEWEIVDGKSGKDIFCFKAPIVVV